jgi:glyoxylase-like metal-dependent hydrolase (beta-lactamase superfamily II)
MKTYTIRPVVLCYSKAEKGFMTYLAGYGEKITRPYLFWVVERTGTRILVDTGIEANDYLSYDPSFSKLEFHHVCKFEEGLKRLGMRPGDVKLVIQTHLHFDHCFNLRKCVNAEVLVQEDEVLFAREPHPIFSKMYSLELLKHVRFITLKGREEVLPGIEVVPVPGHSPGCQAVRVNTEAGRAVISGFCCIRENFFPPSEVGSATPLLGAGEVIPPGIHWDLAQAYDSMLTVKKMGEIILPQHDPELMNIVCVPEESRGGFTGD